MHECQGGGVTHWSITFAPVPGNVPVPIRVRRLLKESLRRFGLKAVEIRELNAPEMKGKSHVKK